MQNIGYIPVSTTSRLIENREEGVTTNMERRIYIIVKEHNMHRTAPTILQEDLELEDIREKGDNRGSQMTSNCHPSTVKKTGRCG